MDIVNKTLFQLSLSDKEIRFFRALFDKGPMTVNETAKVSRLERSTAYLVCQKLIEQGLVEEDHKQYKKRIFAIEPKKLLQIVASKQRSFRKTEIELQEQLPMLQSAYSLSEIRPQVKVFEGNKGLLTIWKDILSAKGEILLWTNQETENNFFTKELHDQFIGERIKKGLFIKVLSVNNNKGMALKENDSPSLRQTKLLPEKVNFSSETYIYEHKIATLDYNKDIIGVIIESTSFADTQRSVFEMAWNSL